MKGRVPPRTTLPLISAQRDTDLDLIEFLRPYKRLRAEKVCTQPVDSSQVTVWTFKGGAWTRGVPNRTVHTGSWCQSYLTSALNLSRAEYDQAKKELFSQASGLNGLYQHKSQDLYAMVYRPQTWLNKRNIAAIAGGTALVGLGVAGTRYALRNPQAQASLKVPPGSKPPSSSQDLETRIREYDKELVNVLKRAESERPSDQDFKDLSTYKDLLEKHEYPIKVEELRKKVIMFESLLAMDASRKTLHDLFDADADAILKSALFTRHGDDIARYFEADGDVDRLNTHRAAQIYQRMQQDLQKEEPQLFYYHLVEMFELYQKCNLLYPPSKFIFGLSTMSSDVRRAFARFLKEHETKQDAEDTQQLDSIILVLQDALREEHEMPIVDTQRIASPADIKCRLDFFSALKHANRDTTSSVIYTLANKAGKLYNRVVALQNLRQSQSKTIEDVVKLNASYKIQDGLDESKKENEYIRMFAESWTRDEVTPQDVRELLNNLKESDMYKRVFEALRAKRPENIPWYFELENYVKAVLQLREDFRTQNLKDYSEEDFNAVLSKHSKRNPF